MGEVIFKEQKLRNVKMEETLKEVLRVNELYMGLIEDKLKQAKKAREEILNGTRS